MIKHQWWQYQRNVVARPKNQHGQPVILKIVVSEVAPPNKKSPSGTDSP
jgi:hypothetical protein